MTPQHIRRDTVARPGGTLSRMLSRLRALDAGRILTHKSNADPSLRLTGQSVRELVSPLPFTAAAATDRRCAIKPSSKANFDLGDQGHGIPRITRSEDARAGHPAGSASDPATDAEDPRLEGSALDGDDGQEGRQ